MVVDSDKFLTYLIFSKHIDEFTCGEIKEAAKMCKVDLIDEIKSTIEEKCSWYCFDDWGNKTDAWESIENVIDEFSTERLGEDTE